MEREPWLTQLSTDDHTVIAVVYLNYLTQGHTHYSYQTQYSTLLGYMDSMAAWVQTCIGRDIHLEAANLVTQHL